MSRRRARGAQARRRAIEKVAACPDCDSDVRTMWKLGKLSGLQIRHNSTCPWYRAHGGTPFQQLRLEPLP